MTDATTETHATQTAIDYLCATKLPEGDYSYTAQETGDRYRVSTSDLLALADYLAREDESGRMGHGGYSEWCADGYGSLIED